jgi:hypothetical protein
MKKITLLLAFVFTFISCSGDDEPIWPINQNPDTLLLDKTVSKNYSINQGAPVTTYWHYSGMKLSYTQNSDGVRTDYDYTGDLITSIRVNNGAHIVDSELGYDFEQQLVSIATGNQLETFTYESDGTIVHRLYANESPMWTATLTVANGAILQISKTYHDGFQTTHQFGYDGKRVPTQNIVGFERLYLSGRYPHDYFKNVVYKTYSDSDGVTGDITKTIVYNALGFPTSISSADDHFIESYDDEYIYK